MRATLGLMLLCGCVSAGTPPPVAPVRPSNVADDAQFVRGKAVIRDAHCAKEKVTPESDAKLRRPAANLTLKLYVGRENLPVPANAVIQTDAEGRWDGWLKPETYCVVLGTRSREAGSLPAAPESVAGHVASPECLKALESRCDGELVVAPRQQEVWADLIGRSCAWSSPCPEQIAPAPAVVP